MRPPWVRRSTQWNRLAARQTRRAAVVAGDHELIERAKNRLRGQETNTRWSLVARPPTSGPLPLVVWGRGRRRESYSDLEWLRWRSPVNLSPGWPGDRAAESERRRAGDTP